jgi:diguanylate cyclase (GGDEF)-like protein
MIDVDNFKKINDTYGYIAGDHVLRELAGRMQCVLRKDDVLARFAGEVFSILMVESGLEETLEVADRCREAVDASKIDTAAGRISATISLGVVARENGDIGSPDELITDAIERLYEAKSNGRNRVVC